MKAATTVQGIACELFLLRDAPRYAELSLGRCTAMTNRPGTFVSPTYPRACGIHQPAPSGKTAARIEWLRDVRAEGA